MLFRVLLTVFCIHADCGSGSLNLTRSAGTEIQSASANFELSRWLLRNSAASRKRGSEGARNCSVSSRRHVGKMPLSLNQMSRPVRDFRAISSDGFLRVALSGITSSVVEFEVEPGKR